MTPSSPTDTIEADQSVSEVFTVNTDLSSTTSVSNTCDFGDGSTPPAAGSVAISGTSGSFTCEGHTYCQPGTYTLRGAATLGVTSASATSTITVSSYGPTITLTSTQDATDTFTFTAEVGSFPTCMSDPTVSIDFGDGTSGTITLTGPAAPRLTTDTFNGTVTKTYTTAGTYNVVAQATLSNGDTDSSSASVTFGSIDGEVQCPADCAECRRSASCRVCAAGFYLGRDRLCYEVSDGYNHLLHNL